MDSAVMLLPQPDSPTMATVSRGPTVKERSSTALRMPLRVWNQVRRPATERTGFVASVIVMSAAGGSWVGLVVAMAITAFSSSGVACEIQSEDDPARLSEKPFGLNLGGVMDQRVALVTGAARGIGAGIAARLARDGYRVVAADVEAAAVAGGGPAVQCDVGDELAVAALAANVAEQEGRLDALICNAGIMIRKPIAALTFAEWSRVLATNLTSAFLLVRAMEGLLRASKGAVVTIASTRAHMSEPYTEAYAASKGGLVALTHALAISLGPDVRVNCISPGWILTKGPEPGMADHAQHPAGRVGRVEDIAALAAFLVAAESGFVTGAEFVVDGGMTRKMIYVE